MFCLLLLLIRLLKTNQFSFLFLIWNLFLAWLPYCFIRSYARTRKPLAKAVVIGLTILFLPNAPYILTDLFHLTKNPAVPMWFDLILILSFALLGMVFFILAFNELMAVISPWFRSKKMLNLTKNSMLFATGYGIYLGRYLRFNSWDVVSSPFELITQMFYSIFDPACFKETVAVSFIFAIFLYLVIEITNSMTASLKPKHHDLS